MNKKIYYLAGKGNCGKTATVKLVYKKLLREYPDAATFFDVDDAATEILQVLKINQKIIGISSQGDTGKQVLEHLNRLVSKKCEIIITATRTSGRTIEAVKSVEPSYEACGIKQTYESEPERHSASNQAMATSLVNKVKAVINA